MAIAKKDKFLDELFETAVREMNIEELTAGLTSDYNKYSDHAMAVIRKTIKDTLQPMFQSMSSGDVYEIANYTCHGKRPTMVDKLFDKLGHTKNKEDRTKLYARIALYQFCDDECARREGRMTYEEFLAKQKKNVISKEIETELKNLVKVENAIKKNKEKERNLFQKLFAKNKKEDKQEESLWWLH